MINRVIDSLKDGYLLEKEEDMAGFLGIQVTRENKKGMLSLTQTGLTDKTLHSMDLQDSKPKYTPADKIPLHKDLLGAPCGEEYDYRSIAGMMIYLVGSTRPDVVFSVHQCARFSHAPKHSHEIGLKHIARYLKGTREKSLATTLDKSNLKLNLFADSDFTGLFSAEDCMDPIRVKSRT